jgi:hypothetical protein
LRPFLEGREGEVTVVEPTREALAALDVLFAGLGSGLRVRLLQDSLADLGQGAALRAFRGQDLVVLDGLLDYLPTRPATQGLGQVCACLAPHGHLVATAMAPATDGVFWHLLLDWPAIGREPAALAALAEASGFEGVFVGATDGAGLVLEARAP